MLEFETKLFYKIFDDLPEIPQDLVDEYILSTKSSLGPGHKSLPGYIRDDGRTDSPELVSEDLSDDIKEWIDKNIITAASILPSSNYFKLLIIK